MVKKIVVCYIPVAARIEAAIPLTLEDDAMLFCLVVIIFYRLSFFWVGRFIDGQGT